MKVISCALCGQGNFLPYMKVGRREIVKCRHCAFIFSYDIPSQEEMERHYSFEMQPDFLFKYQDEIIKRGKLIIKYAQKPRGKLLDVGCGLGFFLGWAKEKGYRTYGVELSVEASEHAKRIFGVNVFTGDICRIDMGMEIFDIVTIQHVLEHIPNPLEFLGCVYGILKKDGVLAVVVPNAGSLMAMLAREKWLAFAVEEHLCYYTKKTLRLLLERCGFKVQKIMAPQWSIKDLLWAVKVFLARMLKPLFPTQTSSPSPGPSPLWGEVKVRGANLFRPLAWLVSDCGLGQEIIVFAKKI